MLYPAVAEAARRAGADAVGLVDVGRYAGLNLHLDRVGFTYRSRTGGGRGRTGGHADEVEQLGDASSAVQRVATVVGDRPVPVRSVPAVLARVGVDRDPVDVTDPAHARWLGACLGPDQPERLTSLTSELALVTAEPPLLLRGNPVALLAEACARVPAEALPVITTTWALSRWSPERRHRFRQGLTAASAGRTVTWVSVEGVGVAPSIPTLGDRRASGHSMVGVAVFSGSTLHAEAVGRCWSRGRMLSWLADS